MMCSEATINYLCRMTPTEVIQQLNSMQLPQSVTLSEWEYVPDVRQCIDANIHLMRQAGPGAEQTTAWDILRRLRTVLTEAG